MATSSSTDDSTQNPGSVYYIHPTNHASLKLVSNVFDGTGFGDWKHAMMIGLIAKNKVCFVDGTLTKPSETDSNYKAWERCNNIVIGWLIASLDRLMAKSVIYYSYAHEIWSDLEERFGTSTSTQIYSLHEDLSKLSQEPNMSIAEYFTKVKPLWDELDSLNPLPFCDCNGCSCGLTKKVLKLQQNQRLMSFLMKVDEQYNPIKTNILMLPELPNVSTAYRMLQQEQRHKEISKMSVVHNESMAFAVNKRTYYDKHSTHNKHHKTASAGSYAKPSYGSEFKRSSPFFCDHCKLTGHSIDRCFKLHGYPPGFKHKRFANCVQQEDSKTDKENKENFGLTPKQMNTLLNFLNKQQDHSSDPFLVDNSDPSPSAHLAGKFCFFSKHTSS